MSNPRRTAPTRHASSSTSISGGQYTTTQTPTHYYEDSETTLPPSQSPSLNTSAHGSGHSSEYQGQFRRPSHQPTPLSQITGRPVVAEPQDLDLGQLPGYGFPPGGALVIGWPNPAQAQSGVGFGAYYEPQGELQAQLQAQLPPQQDFVSPTPIPARPESAFSEPTSSFGDSRQPSSGMIATARANTTADMSGRAAGPPSIITRAGQKRKADSRTGDRRESVATATSQQSPTTAEPKRPSVSRPSVSGVRTEPASPRVTRSQRQAQGSEADDDDEDEAQEPAQTIAEAKPVPPKLKQSDSNENRRVAEVAAHLTTVLPAGKVFPIQIGSDLFRLSGASISSDGKCDRLNAFNSGRCNVADMGVW